MFCKGIHFVLMYSNFFIIVSPPQAGKVTHSILSQSLVAMEATADSVSLS